MYRLRRTYWNAFPSPGLREIARLLWRDLDRAGDEARTPQLTGTAGWVPAVEMHQTENEVVLRAELPGLKRHEIEIDATEEGVTIRGERKASEHACGEGATCCTELCYGPFERALAWPVAVKHNEAKATLSDGVLEIRVALAEEAKAIEPTKVAIA